MRVWNVDGQAAEILVDGKFLMWVGDLWGEDWPERFELAQFIVDACNKVERHLEGVRVARGRDLLHFSPEEQRILALWDE